MNWNLSSRADAWARLKHAKPEAWVLRHCSAVECLAAAMAGKAVQTGLQCDQDLVSHGAILHDIGRSVTNDLRHASIGADLLREDPQPEPLVRIVERHTGAGIAADEADEAGLPSRDYVPSTLEEKIVAHADNLYSGHRRLTLGQIEAKYETKALPQAWHRILALHNELNQLLDCDLETLAPAKLERLS